MADLFDYRSVELSAARSPLAARMRPRSIEEFIGQDHLVGDGRPFRVNLDLGYLPSIIFWGPPGTGKTSLANLIAQHIDATFISISAVTSGVADVRKIIDNAKATTGMYGHKTLLFIDEIHRFNKAQQDVILPYVEDGTVSFIGATTENPSFEVIAPLLSRCRLFVLNPLNPQDIENIIVRALNDKDQGLANWNVSLDENACEYLIKLSNGDARRTLNLLEFATVSTNSDAEGKRHITIDVLGKCAESSSLIYDKSGDNHYDGISAYIKSIRSSDPDAAIYWLARMLEAGEDPMFIARRLVIAASEDIGMADPNGLSIAVAAQQAVHFIGMPEGGIPLAQATVYLSTAPKSNSSYMALNRALEKIRDGAKDPIPKHLRNPVTKLMKEEGYGEGYKYAHDFEGNFILTQNLPDSMIGVPLYTPTENGYEKIVVERIKNWWGDQKQNNELNKP
ncbi:replication-associated recombination protein A [Dehalococcoidia bacterium]|nr:replication-associated recombination protein A [Dehalococcoidia bacterium]